MTTTFAQIHSGRAVAMDRLPVLTFDDLANQALDIVGGGGKIVHFFGYQAPDGLRLMAVLRTEILLAAVCDLPATFPSLTVRCASFHLFERELAEQFGVRPQGHPWLKMVRYHPNFTGASDVFGNDYSRDIPGNYPYYAVSGPGIHEVAVGPVHAGVIEPGHFRFNCIGERVLHLEIQLGYQHRGVEAMAPRLNPSRLAVVAEGIAGDTAVGNSLCLAQAVEALAGIQPDEGAAVIRTLALELERIANHVGDLGALSGDVAFLPPANYCGRMRGDFLNLTLWICGNRFGKGLVRPGGVRFDLTDEDRATLNGRLAQLSPQVAHVSDLLFSTSSVRARFEGCGTVSQADADALGLVGPAGRASGLAYDVRRAFPTERYAGVAVAGAEAVSGDVYARARIRATEVRNALDIIEALLKNPIHTACVGANAAASLAPNAMAVTINEAWRGELSHCLITDAAGGILRYKVKDPSFHNWSGLAMALRNTGISDFPLNNKSFNLSYCGFDL
jgi:Ni,Fe-hydrogenase III large subunit